MAIGGRANNAQPACSPHTSNHLDLFARDNLATNQAEAFLIQRMPWPELIEPSKRFQSIDIGQVVRRRENHVKSMPLVGSIAQSGGRRIAVSVKILVAVSHLKSCRARSRHLSYSKTKQETEMTRIRH
jgi:hypothetical protein